MRVYVATTLADLAGHVAAGAVPPGAERFVPADVEAEYDALMAAAEASAALLAGPGRRVVVVADVAGEAEADAAIPLRRVVAVHADAETLADPAAHPEDDLGWYATQEIPGLLSGAV
ncbi:DUF6912 family protein [Nocardioides donggukensis]|uniref:Uncharacterized protein n=1 Tax=Nocardioides donggukensis TaxID=2774019 RepID=A0A927Q0R7_9ACTN|nr:hypothetical protein [Nocardioides donggukensis]MBD8868739.1 hypothetical protein [Nocardioides donggukensis]